MEERGGRRKEGGRGREGGREEGQREKRRGVHGK